MFEQSLVLPTPTHKRWTFAVSLTMQVAVLSMLVLVPLIYTEQLSQVLNRGTLFGPSVPPGPPPVPIRQQMQPRTRTTRTLQALSFLPSRVLKPLSQLADDVFNEAPAQVCPNC